MTDPTPSDPGSTSFVAWLFPSALGVDAAELRVKRLEQQGRLDVRDLVTLIWFTGEGSPRVTRRHPKGEAAGKGALLGGVVGAVLGGPLAAAAVGAAAASLGRRHRGLDVPQEVIAAVREELGPGSSALLLLTSSGSAEVVRAVTGNEPDVRVVQADLDAGKGMPIDRPANDRPAP